MGIRRKTLIVFSLASILVLAGFSTILNEKAYAGNLVGTFFGDFVCWIPFQGISTVVPLGIEDQFGPTSNAFWEQAEYCAAAEKNLEPSPFSPDLAQHYQSWFYPDSPEPFEGPGTGQVVTITVPQFNQEFTTTLGPLDQLMVPATKFVPPLVTPVPSIDNEQHWNCYEITGPVPEPFPVDLLTQHGDIGAVSVGEPFLFCTPVIKTNPAGQPFGALLDEHRICYDIFSDFDGSDFLPVGLEDQLGLFPFNVDFLSVDHPKGLEKLCVPALKSFPTVGGSNVPINTSALLVAAIGVNPVITVLVAITIAGVAGQIAWIVHKKKRN